MGLDVASPKPGRTFRRFLLVVNEHSRRGHELGDGAEAALRRRGIEVVRRASQSRTDVSALIRTAGPGFDGVVVGGGDGTLNAAAPGLLETGLSFGILPLGTANDLARTLAIPADIEGAADVIARGHLESIDVGTVNGHPYFNVASLGFGVDLTRALTRDAKKRWGPLGYAIAGLRALNRLRAFHAEIRTGTEVYNSRTVHLAVGNGRHYGGGMTVSEEARIDDGRLDVYSLEVENVWRLLRLLPALRSGKTHQWHEIRTLAGQEIEVRTRRPRSVNADGEIVTKTPAAFKILRGAVRVFAPWEPRQE